MAASLRAREGARMLLVGESGRQLSGGGRRVLFTHLVECSGGGGGTPTSIGCVGLGVMGSGMAACLLRAGHPVTVTLFRYSCNP